MNGEHTNILVLGAGYGGLTAALRLARLFRGDGRFRICLADRYPHHTLKTQLHEAAVRRAEVTIPIDRVIRKWKIQFHLGEVDSIDPASRQVTIGGNAIPFGFLVIALGSKANYYSIPGLSEFSFPLQSSADAAEIYGHIAAECARAAGEESEERRRQYLRFVVGGGGLTGIEFAAELAEHAASTLENFKLRTSEMEVIVIEAASDILPTISRQSREETKKKLLAKGVKILTNLRIVEQSDEAVTLSSGEILRTNTLIWTGGIRISQLFQKSGLKTGPLGRILVDEYLRVADVPNIYAIGDNAYAINPVSGQPMPAAAQFALQQGRLVAENIYSAVRERPLQKYHPRVWGEVISLGRHLAVGWLTLPFSGKLSFIGFIGRLVKTAIKEKHIILLKKESRNWITF